MTAPAKDKAPARRLLAHYPTEAQALIAKPFWKRLEGDDADVQVEYRAKGTTDERPYGVTAAKSGGGS